jgi:ABC-type bacteriocin/lantibiotic exporter with double-glycine peptidase domain
MGSDFEPESYLRAKALSKITELSDDYVLSEACSLSGGQMQRVNLARALYKALRTDKVLILDEPLSQLDPNLVSEISSALASLRSSGFRIIAASHQSELIRLADREVRIG